MYTSLGQLSAFNIEKQRIRWAGNDATLAKKKKITQFYTNTYFESFLVMLLQTTATLILIMLLTNIKCLL